MSIKTERETRYIALAKKVEGHIRNGTLRPGQAVPPIRKLMAEGKLSAVTVLKGLSLLEEQGLIQRLSTRGYFVTDHQRPDPTIASIAFVTPALVGDTADYVKGLSEALGASDKFTLGTYCTNADLDRYQELIERMARLRPAGIVLMTIAKGILRLDAGCLARAGIPTVMIGDGVLGLDGDRVHYSGQDTGRKLIPYLLQKGYRDFSMLTISPEIEPTRRDLISIIRKRLHEADLDLPDERIFMFRGTHGFAHPPDPCIDAQQTTAALLASGVRFKTLICCHDYTAVGAFRAVLAAGLRVPQDVQIASVQRNAVDGLCPMKLTTMDISSQVMGTMAGELLLRRMNGYSGHPEIHYVSADLVVGDTA